MERPAKLTVVGKPPSLRTSGTGAVATVARAIRRAIAEFGVAVTLLYAGHRLLQRISGDRGRLVCYGLYAQPIGAGQFAAVRDDSATVVARADSAGPLVTVFPRPASVIAQRFLQGAQCYVATVRGAFAGFIWMARGWHEEDEVRCRYELPDCRTAVWDFDVYVEPRLRMGRTLARLWKAVDADLAQDGVRWSFSRISLFNRGSITTHERLGAVRVGRAVFVCIGPVQVTLLSSAPFLHISIGANAGPTIRLSPPME